MKAIENEKTIDMSKDKTEGQKKENAMPLDEPSPEKKNSKQDN